MIDRTKAPEPVRGTVYSTDGRILAQSESRYDFWVFFDKVPCTSGFFMALADAAGVSETRFSAPFGEGKRRVWLHSLDSEQYARVIEVKRKWAADGVSLEEQRERSYPLGSTTVGVVGWMHEGSPKSGIERSLDDELSGKNAHGVVPNGSDVVLTIDSQLQSVASIAIQNAVKTHAATSGSAIVMVPKTGAILAMADWPMFDPQAGPAGSSERAVSYMEDLQPGSTFKILTLAKALDSKVAKEGDLINCTGVYDLGGGKTVKCDRHNGKREHGLIGLDMAIGKSCNIAAATWALKIGRDNMIVYMRDLGLLSKPEIGLKGAAAPLFDINEYDKRRQLATLGFGQSIAVPPIVLAGAINAIANDGEYVAPNLIAQIGSKSSVLPPRWRVISKEAAKTVRRMMECVMHEEWGTGSTLAIPGMRIAGKTGTAQKLGAGGGNVSSFVGMFPADEPQILILVMVNDPKGGEFYGSLVAGPAFDEIAYAVIERLNIPKTSTPRRTAGASQ